MIWRRVHRHAIISPSRNLDSTDHETVRRKITSSGIEYLQSLEEKEIKIEAIPAEKIETRLVETYDRTESDMEEIR